MKQYKEKKTGMIWVAVDKQHIKYFDSNPNFIEVKKEEKFDKKKVVNTNIKKEDNSNK